jgi:hypothetical protein
MGVEQCYHILIPYPTIENRYRKLLEQFATKHLPAIMWCEGYLHCIVFVYSNNLISDLRTTLLMTEWQIPYIGQTFPQ